VLGIPLYHGLLHDSTYMSQVEVDIPLHNVLTIGSCGTLLDLYLFQILLYLVLHLYSQFVFSPSNVYNLNLCLWLFTRSLKILFLKTLPLVFGAAATCLLLN
jgi:hypothetical protein